MEGQREGLEVRRGNCYWLAEVPAGWIVSEEVFGWIMFSFIEVGVVGGSCGGLFETGRGCC